MKVQSLKRTIVGQFAVILLPLVGLLAFQSLRHVERNAVLERLYVKHEQAVAIRDQFRTFLNGAETAVDTGQLSRPALDALVKSSQLLEGLGRTADVPDFVTAAGDLADLAAVLAQDRSLERLQGLLPRINKHRELIADADARSDAELDTAIERSIEAAQRDGWIVGFLSLLLVVVTIVFIARMIRGLSMPLSLAVSVANRIAAGKDVGAHEFRSQRDLGNLLGSLAGMHENLQRYRAEVDATHRALEEKVQQLSESQTSLAEAQSMAQIGSWYWDIAGRTLHMSDQLYQLLGAKRGDFEPKLATFLAMVDLRERGILNERLETLQRESGSFADEFRVHCMDGQVRTVHHLISSRVDASGRVDRLCGVLQDITQRRQAEAEIRRLAHYDSLTGLPNRRYFQDQLAHALARAKRAGEKLATLFLDLDRFKRINDTLGHAAGDALLKEVARRLTACVRETDYIAREVAPDRYEAGGEAPTMVARLAGDEFTVALVALERPQDAALVAQRILAEMAKPIRLADTELVATASIGIAVFPSDGETAEQLLKSADAAMYRAKELGKNTYQFFAEDMNTAASATLRLESELRKAIERDQFILYYQPKVDAASGRIAGLEALIRWKHPEWGLMSPGQFIPVAEEAGLIVAIGEWVLEAACRQLHAWREQGLPEVSVAVNLAGPSFRQRDLVLRVQGALDRHGVPARLLQLEVTESMMMDDVGRSMRTLKDLRDIGVRISVDDFGTGYSSLSYLRRFPIDQLKIDGSFVAEMANNPDDAAIVRAIVSLGRSLGLEVVAEGVETFEQVHLLRQTGCDQLQGFCFSRPLPPADVAVTLRSGGFALDPLAAARTRSAKLQPAEA